MTEPLFEDPGEALLARGTADPFDALTASEQDQRDQIRVQANGARTLAEVTLVLGAAFLLYRAVVARKTSEEVTPDADSRLVRWLVLKNSSNFIPSWVYMVTPALEAAYTFGAVKAGGTLVPDQMVGEFAQRYAADIANYFTESSADALIEGFNSYVNKKLPRRLAADRALKGFGLNSRMMRSLVGRVARGRVDSVVELDHDASTRDFIETMLVQRAHDIGENEGFNVSQHGLQLSWMYLQKQGRLSALARKMWLTARDERVCRSCGPMHKKEVLVNEPFETPYGKLWVPSMHPNCRCEVRLRVPVKDDFELAKADNWLEREHPRGEGGRFSNKPTQYAERTIDPTLERLIREVQASRDPELEEEVDLGASQVDLGQADLGSTTSLGSSEAQLGDSEVDLAGPGLDLGATSVALTADGPNLDTPIELGSAELVDLDRQLTLRAKESTSAILQAPRPATPIKTHGGVIQLPDSLYFMDPAGFHYYEDYSPIIDHMEPTYAHFEQHHEFTTLQNVEEQINVVYEREIDREANRLIAMGKNHIESIGRDPIMLAPDFVKMAIKAEVLGVGDQPGMRNYARAMGVNRADWILYQYRIDRAHAESFEGFTSAHGSQEYFSAPGRYMVDAEEYLTDEGWPLVVMVLEPDVDE